jgi:hypothetical protein
MPPRPRSQEGDRRDAAERLYDYAASLRAVEGSDVNQFTACLEALAELSKALDAPLAIVGGLAAIHHGARVTTLDVDVAVGKDQLRRLVEAGPRCGFKLQAESERGWHKLVFQHPAGDVDVDVIPEGQNGPRDPAHAPPNPSPEDLGVVRGVGYADFAAWAVMKLVTGRDKDRYHLTEVLKAVGEAQIAAVVLRLRKLHPSYLCEFERLVRAAEDEKQDRW